MTFWNLLILFMFWMGFVGYPLIVDAKDKATYSSADSDFLNKKLENKMDVPLLAAVKQFMESQKHNKEDAATLINNSSVSAIFQSYLGDFIDSSMAIDHGFSRVGTNGKPVEIDDSLLKHAANIRDHSLEVLLWIKDNHPDFYYHLLAEAQLYNYLVPDDGKEKITTLRDLKVSDSVFSLQTICNDKENRSLKILLQAHLIDQRELEICDDKEPPKIFDCFPAGSPFLNTLGNSKAGTNYFYGEGSDLSKHSQAEQAKGKKSSQSSPSSCTFLGGSWSLDKKDPSQIAKGSKVKVLTPDNKTLILLADDLTVLRKQWQKSQTQTCLEQSTKVLFAMEKGHCGF